jgi:hypothetical protein
MEKNTNNKARFLQFLLFLKVQIGDGNMQLTNCPAKQEEDNHELT